MSCIDATVTHARSEGRVQLSAFTLMSVSQTWRLHAIRAKAPPPRGLNRRWEQPSVFTQQGPFPQAIRLSVVICFAPHFLCTGAVQHAQGQVRAGPPQEPGDR